MSTRYQIFLSIHITVCVSESFGHYSQVCLTLVTGQSY